MSKFISLNAIQRSISDLSKFHVFFGTTYLVLKKHEAPVGETMHLVMDKENNLHLKKYFRLHPKSDYFFSPFQKKKSDSYWRSPKYASTSLQAVNTQSFEPALIHPRTEKEWGWKTDYVQFLISRFPRERKLPLVNFSIWFGRDIEWPDQTTIDDIISYFIRTFHLSADDLDMVFDSVMENNDNQYFAETSPKWQDIIEGFGVPPDVPLDTGATLQFLEFSGIGPIKKIEMEPGSRLNIITGDNGLGKTFLLDVVWWALTQQRLEQIIVPLENMPTPPEIKFIVSHRPNAQLISSVFNNRNYTWSIPRRTEESGLTIYARVDGSFAISDSIDYDITTTLPERSITLLNRDQIWQGDNGKKIEGIIRDWVKWQTRKDEFSVFDIFKKVIERLRPPDMEDMRIGAPIRLPGFSMELPTLHHPYGQVPIIFESAGIKRILSLVYLIVWAWEEHRVKAKQYGKKEESQLVLLIDEAEAHLHPKWQRIFLNSLLQVAHDLREDLKIQYFITTHSPMLLASAEDVWNISEDKIYHLNIDGNGSVRFSELPFEVYGSSDAWLQSVFFDYLPPVSPSAEEVMTRANKLMADSDPDPKSVKEVNVLLVRHVPPENPFWLRWILFVEKVKART